MEENKKSKLLDVLATFRLGVIAGVLIGIGGAINLALSAKGWPVLGGFCFSTGLLSICFLGLKLFTGKVGYVPENDRNYALDVLIMAIGNFLGAMLVGYVCGALFPGWTSVSPSKFVYGEGSSWWACLGLAVFAGMFVYLAVECFRKIPSVPAKALMVMLSIGAMVILGCNHSVANAFYFAYAAVRVEGFDHLNAVASVAMASLGNIIGAILLYFLQYGISQIGKKKEESK